VDRDGAGVLGWAGEPRPIERAIAAITSPNSQTIQRRSLQRVLGPMRMSCSRDASTQFDLTPVRVGLILIAVLVFGVIFARVIVMSGQSEDRTDSIPESARTTVGGVKGLRGSLP
jgi:hypothetical protein